MRRSIALLAFAASLGCIPPATAALRPIRRDFGELTLPRVRTGTVRIPADQASGRLRVIVTLRLPPLASAYSRSLALRASLRRRLDPRAAFSREYLAHEAAVQRTAIATLVRAIPEARVSWHYRVVLDGFAVDLPYRDLPTLFRQGFAAHVYPSGAYRLDLNQSPSLIGAPQLEAATGAHGEGTKIGIIDDGIDQTSTFFNPTGFAYPPGFPKGNTAFTTPKVIVARAFPGPHSGPTGKLPLDRRLSFHGTHVAGIAAGDAGTFAPPGIDHPGVAGLSGIAPRAWLGNYRIFNVPDPFNGCCVAQDPEIVKAMDTAVSDGMDVINMSLGAPEASPQASALGPAVKNVTAAGVVVAVAAGNDRDVFGLGTVESPGTAPDAITVAAVSNSHFFGRALTLVSPSDPSLKQVAVEPGLSGIPASWATRNQALIDVGTITGSGGKQVERHLCGPSRDVNGPGSPLPAGSLRGAVALVERGTCTFVSKAERVQAAGGIGMVVVDNRPGDPNDISADTVVPSAMVSSFDGGRLEAALDTAGGRGSIRIGRDELEISTPNGGVPASFSAGGLTDFDHELKPDISAPGTNILSATLPEFADEPFAPFSGTSMAAPHIAGAAALLLQLHPSWTPAQVKSALMSTAGPAFADSTKTSEAPVLIEGAGLAQLTAANDPKIFTAPESLSFQYLDISAGAAAHQIAVSVSDAGGGAGTWQVTVEPQSQTTGATVAVPSTIAVPAGGSTTLAVSASAGATAAPGDDYGFVVLAKEGVRRRIPYAFSVTRPELAVVKPVPLRRSQTGDTRKGIDRAEVYRWPTNGVGPFVGSALEPVHQTGREKLYVTAVNKRAVNVGVAVVKETPNALVDPWFLGSPDENDVLGYAGTPAGVNGSLPFEFGLPIAAAGAFFAPPGRYYVAVDSGRNRFTGASFAGRYVLRSWENDITPPHLKLITTRVAAGRPTIVFRARDSQAGVDPFTLLFNYGRTIVLAAAYDSASGIVVVPLPLEAPLLVPGRTHVTLIASDFQESKNVNTVGSDLMPNTTFLRTRLDVGQGPNLYWVLPGAGSCAAPRTRLVVVGSDTEPISSVSFYAADRKLATVRRGIAGLYVATWKTKGEAKGGHKLRAELVDGAGRHAQATRVLRVCGKNR